MSHQQNQNKELAPQHRGVDRVRKAYETTWEEAEKHLIAKDTEMFLGALAFQEVDYSDIDQWMQKVWERINTTFNPPSSAVRVSLNPRGSYASRTTLRGHVDLDLDLVFPEEYKIEFADNTQKRIIDVLSIGEANAYDRAGNLCITKTGLRLALLYVWGKLAQGTGFKLPLAPDSDYVVKWAVLNDDLTMAPLKEFAELTRSLPAKITFPKSGQRHTEKEKHFGQENIDVDFFIKVVCTRFNKEQVLVGVDKDGPVGDRQYQVTTFIPDDKSWVGDMPLSPINRTALLALKWWKNSFGQDKTIKDFNVRNISTNATAPSHRKGKKTDIKIKSHHFLSAINFLTQVHPTDPLYIPVYSSLPFSLVRVIDLMIKVLTFLYQAYKPAVTFAISYPHDWFFGHKPSLNAVYPFPPVSCGVYETLYKQVTADMADYDAIINSDVIPAFLRRLRKAQSLLAHEGFKAEIYTYEKLSEGQ